VWSPDGSRIAYLRIAAARRDFMFGPERAGQPWSIRVTDCQTGQAQQIFLADKGPGSVFSAVVALSQLFWSTQGQIVFPWEKTGWRHLYSVPASGGTPVDLTPGEGEVEHVSMQRNKAYFSANFGDIDRRHLWSVDAAGKQPPAQLTNGETMEWAPAPAADGSALLFLASSYNEKSHAAVRLATGITRPSRRRPFRRRFQPHPWSSRCRSSSLPPMACRFMDSCSCLHPKPPAVIPRCSFFMAVRAVRCCWASTTCITTQTPTP
jgi:hypothetical protein